MPFSLITAEITTDGIIKSVELGKILMRWVIIMKRVS
jgi:hypothetical protein